jgi:flagellar M-ring protein FliF
MGDGQESTEKSIKENAQNIMEDRVRREMTASLKSFLNRAGEFFQNMEKKKLIMLITLAAVVVAAGIIGAVLLNQVHFTVLYSGLDAAEAGTIKTLLDERGVKNQIRGTGTILVPEDVADELRIELAAQGYPNTGLNYEIFSGASALGSTDLERRTYLQYQLQENMRATIMRMEKVKNCVVIVNLASDSSFVIKDNASEASVAVMLDLKNGQELTLAEARTIGEFVKKCVPDLKAENISIVDSKMKYYDITSKENAEDTSAYTATQMQLTEQMKKILSEQVLHVLEPAVGTGNVAVSVNLSLDFDKQTVSKVEFSPPVAGEDEGLPRSYEELYEGVGPGAADGGQAGTDTNGIGTPAYVSVDEGDASKYSYSKTYNFELNEIQTQIEKAQGAIMDLSVAVLVNSSVEGISNYVDTIRNLVAKAIGVKSDYISVELMPFVQSDSIGDAFEQHQQTLQKISRDTLITRIVTVVAVLAALIIILRIFFRKPAPVGEPAAAGAVAITPGDFMEEKEAEDFELADLMLKKSSEAEKIEELMERYPETVAQILRSWLTED